MTPLTLTALGEISASLTQLPWDSDGMQFVALRGSHARRSEGNQAVLEADGILNDAYWRMLSLLDPARLNASQRNFAYIYRQVTAILGTELAILPSDIPIAARAIARALTTEIARIWPVGRSSISKAAREVLVATDSTAPHCWYCGYRFPDDQIEKFVDGRQTVPGQPLYVDCVAPRGVTQNDLRIEIDHIVPVTRGGMTDVDNLRLACGWCNRHKSSLSILYDAPARPHLFVHPRSGPLLLPAPFWIVRVRGTRRRCEHPQGCERSIDNGAELVVGRRLRSGAFVPGNLSTLCREHDTFSSERLVPLGAFV